MFIFPVMNKACQRFKAEELLVCQGFYGRGYVLDCDVMWLNVVSICIFMREVV